MPQPKGMSDNGCFVVAIGFIVILGVLFAGDPWVWVVSFEKESAV